MMRFIEVRFDNSPNSGYRLSLNDSSLKIHYEEIFTMKSFDKLTCVKTFGWRESSGFRGQGTLVQFWKTPSEIQIIRRGAQNCTNVPHDPKLQITNHDSRWQESHFQLTIWYMIYRISVHLMIDYIFFSYGTFYCNILCYTTKFTKAFSLKDSYQLIPI